ncbi:MAG: hypothetical protein WCT32_00810 [Patescibacteria group bacterium]
MDKITNIMSGHVLIGGDVALHWFWKTAVELAVIVAAAYGLTIYEHGLGFHWDAEQTVAVIRLKLVWAVYGALFVGLHQRLWSRR